VPTTVPPSVPPPDRPDAAPRPAGLLLVPFRGLRPTRTTDVGAVLMPPYDVVDEAAARELAERDAHNAVRLVLPRDPAGEPGGRYAAAAATLAAWRTDGSLALDDEAALYVYEETLPDGHVQRGLLGGVGLTPAEDGIVLPHENTMAGPVTDRLALLTATATDLEPIFLVYDGGGPASEVVAAAGLGDPADPAARPVAEAVTPDGTWHRLWAVTDPTVLARVAADLLPRRAVIADGHHRYATYLRHQAEQHAAGRGNGGWDRGLAMLVDASGYGPQVHAIHRVLPGLPLGEAVAGAEGAFRVERLPDLGRPDDRGDPVGADAALAVLRDTPGPAFLLSDGHTVHLLRDADPARVAAALPGERSAAWRGLDVAVAHLLLVAELWGLADSEGVVNYAHSPAEALQAAARSGGTALLLAPTPVEAVAAVAAAGERMPRKSTLFTPKPATGLVLRPHDDAEAPGPRRAADVPAR